MVPLWDHLGPFRTKNCHLGPFWTVLDHFGPFWTILDHLAISDQMVQNVPLHPPILKHGALEAQHSVESTGDQLGRIQDTGTGGGDLGGSWGFGAWLAIKGKRVS